MELNKNLLIAKKLKNDEFYTFYNDIEKELNNYKEFFKGKKILCPFNDGNNKSDNFFMYFLDNFEKLELEEIVAFDYDEKMVVSYDGLECSIGRKIYYEKLISGDYSHISNKKYFDNADIIISNPPFSILKNIFDFLLKYEKKFILIIPFLKITNKKIFKLFKNQKIFFGKNWIKEFKNEDNEIKKFGNICWFQNLKKIEKRKLPILKNLKNENKIFDNENILIVNKIKNIPLNYNKEILVPTSFLYYDFEKHFEIIGEKVITPYIGKKALFSKILIKRKEKKNV